MKFPECLSCIHKKRPTVCEDCDSGEQFDEDDGLSFEDGVINDD